jgi:hypothetical protein
MRLHFVGHEDFADVIQSNQRLRAIFHVHLLLITKIENL